MLAHSVTYQCRVHITDDKKGNSPEKKNRIIINEYSY